MADLLGADYALAEKNALYRCLDKLLAHKAALFTHLRERWQDLFAARFEVLLYDLTSTYFESAPPQDEEDAEAKAGFYSTFDFLAHRDITRLRFAKQPAMRVLSEAGRHLNDGLSISH